MQIYGCAKISNLNKIQIAQNEISRVITNAPFYVTNQILHFDLQVKTIKQTTKRYYFRYCNSLIIH